MVRSGFIAVVVAGLWGLVAIACGKSAGIGMDGGTGGTGGTPGPGDGSVDVPASGSGSGGASTGAGGASSAGSGGSVGFEGSGGAAGTSTGGAIGSGGASAGGAIGSGSGGTSAGGANGSGSGGTSAGGANGSGSGGSSTGGATGAGGALSPFLDFLPPRLYGISPGSAAPIASGDFNGDGFSDVVYGSTTSVSGTFGVYRVLGLAGGLGITQMVFQSVPASGAVITQLLVGDLENDGRPDVIAATSGGTTYVIRNTAGTLGGATALMAPLVSRLALFDLDKDGLVDLVGLGSSGIISPGGFIAHNAGGQLQVQTAPFLGGQALANAVAGAYFDADSLPDLVVAQGSRIMVYLGNAASEFEFPGTIAQFPEAVNAMTVADLDGDGKVDVQAATNSGLFFLHGTGMNTPSAHMVLVPGPTAGLVAADFDGDGLKDLATLAGPSVLVLRNLGTSFASPASFGTGLATSTQLATAELGGDSRPDLVVAGSGPPALHVLLNASR